jgi:predicted DNA-binding transcriptional regulator AlpA
MKRTVMNEPLKLLVTAEEAARMLSMGRSTFWRNVSAGVLPQPVRIGGLTRWRVGDLVRLVDAGVQAMAEEGRAA